MDEASDYEFRTRQSGTSYGSASGIGACVVGDEGAADDDVQMEVATDVASGGAGSLPTPILGTMAAGPSSGVRPRVTDGDGGKAGNDERDMGEGAERATLSACGKRTAVEEADGYGAGSATSRVGESFGTRLPVTFYEDFARLLEACEIELDDEEETSGGAGSLPTPVLGTTAAGPSAGVRPRVTDGGVGEAGDGKTPRHRGRRLRQLRADADVGPERRAVAARRRGPRRAHVEKRWGPEWARMENPARRPGVVRRKLGNRPDRKSGSRHGWKSEPTGYRLDR
jgi:hypothetical protein